MTAGKVIHAQPLVDAVNLCRSMTDKLHCLRFRHTAARESRDDRHATAVKTIVWSPDPVEKLTPPLRRIFRNVT